MAKGQSQRARAMSEAGECLLDRLFRKGSETNQQSALAKNALGTLARRRQNFPAAESIHLDVQRSLRARGYTDVQEQMQAVHGELVALYEAWGKPDKAAQYRTLLAHPAR